MNRFISSEEIELIIHNLQKQKAPGQDGFIGEFSQTFKEETIPVFYNRHRRDCRK